MTHSKEIHNPVTALHYDHSQPANASDVRSVQFTRRSSAKTLLPKINKKLQTPFY